MDIILIIMCAVLNSAQFHQIPHSLIFQLQMRQTHNANYSNEKCARNKYDNTNWSDAISSHNNLLIFTCACWLFPAIDRTIALFFDDYNCLQINWDESLKSQYFAFTLRNKKYSIRFGVLKLATENWLVHSFNAMMLKKIYMDECKCYGEKKWIWQNEIVKFEIRSQLWQNSQNKTDHKCDKHRKPGFTPFEREKIFARIFDWNTLNEFQIHRWIPDWSNGVLASSMKSTCIYFSTHSNPIGRGNRTVIYQKSLRHCAAIICLTSYGLAIRLHVSPFLCIILIYLLWLKFVDLNLICNLNSPRCAL